MTAKPLCLLRRVPGLAEQAIHIRSQHRKRMVHLKNRISPTRFKLPLRFKIGMGQNSFCRRYSKYSPRLTLIWADGGYAGKLIERTKDACNWLLEIVKRPTLPGFVLLKKRWVVERTFAWLRKYRRLSKDYEYFTDTSEAMIYAAMTHLMLRRLSRLNTS